MNFIVETRRKDSDILDVAKFLYKLGLRRTVPLKNIIVLCASANATVRPVALKYFLDNYATRYSDFDPAYFSDIAFVPALDQTTPCMAMHKDVTTTVLFLLQVSIKSSSEGIFRPRVGITWFLYSAS